MPSVSTSKKINFLYQLTFLDFPKYETEFMPSIGQNSAFGKLKIKKAEY